MQIVEVKNNLVKVSYNTAQENLILSGFIVIKDSVQSFIGQIIHLDANTKGNFALIRLLFLFDKDGVITNYNGSIPDIKSLLDIVQPYELLELLPAQNPVLLGELAQQNTVLKLDRIFLEENVLVCCEKEEDNNLLIKNLATQLASGGKKVLIIDLNGNLDFSENKVVAGVDFKLPLNYETINFIYEKGLDDASSETKALIQEIFLEVQNYVKTLDEKFIPFENFKGVVDAQYQQTDLVELVLLKNKLLKYYDEGVFAQKQDEFGSLKISLQKQEPTILDLSNIDEKIQREVISYAYSLINEFDEKIYVICNLDNANSDKKLLKKIFMTNKAYSTLVCSYSYKYLKELKQLSRNLVLFAPIQQQNDFAGYNTFLSKLNAHEFIMYGKSTHYLPLIVKLEEMVEKTEERGEEAKKRRSVEDNSHASTHSPIHASEEDLLDEQIRRDVDEIYTTPKTTSTGKEEFAAEVVEGELTEEDLDFIDDSGLSTSSNEGEAETEIVEIKDSEGDIEIKEEETGEGKGHIGVESLQNSYEQAASQDETFSDVLTKQAQEEEAETPTVDILPAKISSTPIVPIYSAEIEPKAQSDELEQGDTVLHPKYGKGTVEKLITYGSKTLCSINFDNVGRRLLDPALVEIKKAE